MNIRSCFLLLSILIATPCLLIAQVKGIGNVNSVNIKGQQVGIVTDNAHVEVMVYNANVVRLRIDKQVLSPDFSYAVIAQPEATKVNIAQDANSINISTDSLKVRITKTPFAVTFYNNDGEVISQDETGLTTSWVNESVTTYKKCRMVNALSAWAKRPAR